MKQIITKAVFPVAGLGTRFLPATKASPKATGSWWLSPAVNLSACPRMPPARPEGQRQ